MPRNPNKRRCQRPDCRNWAMRDNVYCRPHLDHQLGPRGAGAPIGNSNAWTHYKHVSPDTAKYIRRIAYDLCRHPDKLQRHITHLVDYFYNHGNSEDLPRTLKAIGSLKIVLDVLLDAHAEAHFHAEMEEILAHLPPERRPGVQRRLWEIGLRRDPLNRVLQIRKARRDINAGPAANPQLPVHPSTSEQAT